eukprot:Nitzschia sp. Nitz4//scaffold291_size36643//31557//33141//NITZ4_007771-RA/size36643-augustus-gene-0.1-mRNA-1//1//CDS//3329546151//4552//frame0
MTTDSCCDSVDAMLATELNSLSVSERNLLLEGMHGVRPIEPESPEMIASKLMELEEELQKTPKAEAYREAMKTEAGRNFVGSSKFRLTFLRTELFNAAGAATRMCLYLEEKKARFGSKSLSRQLTLEDLSVSARTLLTRKGIIQILPGRDNAGRAILASYYNDSTIRSEFHRHPRCLGDVWFYCLSTAAEDEETQKRGVVTFNVLASDPVVEDLKLLKTSFSIFGVAFCCWCPLRHHAVHYWIHRKSARSLQAFNAIRTSMGRPYRLRTLLHPGSYQDCRNQLLTYGIPLDHLPFTMDGGDIRLGAHTKWLKRRRAKEHDQKLSSEPWRLFDTINLPGYYDVCLGRGTAFHQHSGNCHMRTLMQPLVAEYTDAGGSRRQEMNRIIIQAVRVMGGKFLNKIEMGSWFEVVTDEVQIEKCVGGIFRSMVSRLNMKQRELMEPPSSVVSSPVDQATGSNSSTPSLDEGSANNLTALSVSKPDIMISVSPTAMSSTFSS